MPVPIIMAFLGKVKIYLASTVQVNAIRQLLVM